MLLGGRLFLLLDHGEDVDVLLHSCRDPETSETDWRVEQFLLVEFHRTLESTDCLGLVATTFVEVSGGVEEAGEGLLGAATGVQCLVDQAQRFIDLAQVGACSGLDNHHLELHGRVELLGCSLLRELERFAWTPQGALTVGHHGEVVSGPSHALERTVLREGGGPVTGRVGGLGGRLPDDGQPGCASACCVGMGERQLWVVVDQLPGHHQVGRHDGRQVLGQASEFGTHGTRKHLLVNVSGGWRLVSTALQARADLTLLLADLLTRTIVTGPTEAAIITSAEGTTVVATAVEPSVIAALEPGAILTTPVITATVITTLEPGTILTTPVITATVITTLEPGTILAALTITVTARTVLTRSIRPPPVVTGVPGPAALVASSALSTIALTTIPVPTPILTTITIPITGRARTGTAEAARTSTRAAAGTVAGPAAKPGASAPSFAAASRAVPGASAGIVPPITVVDHAVHPALVPRVPRTIAPHPHR